MEDNRPTGEADGLAGLSDEEARAELAKAESALEDLDEMRRFTLGQTGVHIGAERLRSMQAGWTREETNLRQRISLLESRLNS